MLVGKILCQYPVLFTALSAEVYCNACFAHILRHVSVLIGCLNNLTSDIHA